MSSICMHFSQNDTQNFTCDLEEVTREIQRHEKQHQQTNDNKNARFRRPPRPIAYCVNQRKRH